MWETLAAHPCAQRRFTEEKTFTLMYAVLAHGGNRGLCVVLLVNVNVGEPETADYECGKKFGQLMRDRV